MEKSLKILMLEDNVFEAELIQRVLIKEKPDCEFKLVMDKQTYQEALDQFEPDLILSDNTLPGFNATEALEIFNKHLLHIPFILVTGTVSEEFAAGIIKLGADDYILKDRLARLSAAIDAALQKKKTEADIRHSEEVRKLIMNAALDAIVCIDATGAITVWNSQAEKLFGWKEEQIIGKSLAEIILPEQYRETYVNGFHHYPKTGESLVFNKAVEMTALTYTGNEFPVEFAVVPIKQNGGYFFCTFIRDITERKKAEENLKLMEQKILDQKIQEQKKISRAIIQGQEEEKNRIGQELHDNINQILASAKIYLSVAAKKNEVIKESLKYPMKLIDSSIEQIRLLSHKQVTPLKNINLEELVHELLDGLKKNKITKTDFTYSASNEHLSDDLKLNIYRIIQEQLNNILKHADAKNVAILLKEQNNAVNIIITDDGKGFRVDSKRKGIGISNMLNRIESYNGKMEINSSPGHGCKINVAIPC